VTFNFPLIKRGVSPNSNLENRGIMGVVLASKVNRCPLQQVVAQSKTP